METIHFRTITPVFNFSFDDEEYIYNKNGTYRGIRYIVTIKKYGYGEQEYSNILGGLADEYTHEALTSIHIERGYGATDYFMTCDLFYENNPEVILCQNTSETNNIASALVSALNIVSTQGINSKTTYILRKPYISAHYTNKNNKFGATIYGNCITQGPLSSPYFLNALALQKSTFRKEDSKLLDSIIDFYLMDIPETQFTRIFRLAQDYFRLAFTVEKKEHAYLFLMIFCETLFKKGETEKSKVVSSKISKLLATERKSEEAIYKEFYSNDVNSFYNLRNHIIHGNPVDDEPLLKERLLALFKYTRLLLIINITVIFPEIDQMNYFNDLDRLINERYIKMVQINK